MHTFVSRCKAWSWHSTVLKMRAETSVQGWRTEAFFTTQALASSCGGDRDFNTRVAVFVDEHTALRNGDVSTFYPLLSFLTTIYYVTILHPSNTSHSMLHPMMAFCTVLTRHSSSHIYFFFFKSRSQTLLPAPETKF